MNTENQLIYKNPLLEQVTLKSPKALGELNLYTGELRSYLFRDIKKAVEDPGFIILKNDFYFYLRPLNMEVTLIVEIVKVNNELQIIKVCTETDMDLVKDLVRNYKQVYMKNIGVK